MRKQSMKRKHFQNSNPRDRPRTRISCPITFHGVHSYNTRSVPNISPAQKATGCRKRVMFADGSSDDSLSDPQPLQEIGVSKSDDPKTSEYAFFKKLKADAGDHFHCRPLDEYKYKSKFKSTDCARELTSKLKHSSNAFTSFLPIGNVNYDTILSPVDRAVKNSEIDLKQGSTTFRATCSKEKSMEQDHINMRQSGTHFQHADIFSRKRNKLLQWVTETSFPEIDALCSKGYDFISLLLSRLLPRREDNKSFKIPQSGKVESNTQPKLLVSSESDFDFTKLRQMSDRSFTEVEYSQYNIGSSSCWLDSIGDKVVSSSESPCLHAQNTLLPYNMREPACVLEGKDAISCIKSDPVFSSPFRKCEPLALSHLEELDDFYSLDESLLEREPHALLLEWDSENRKRASHLPVNSQNMELITYPTLPTSCNDDYRQSVDNRFESIGAKEFCASVFSIYSPNLLSFLPSYSTCCYKHEFVKDIFQDGDAAPDANHVPFSLWPTCTFVNPTREGNYGTTCKDSCIYPPPEDHGSIMSKILNDRLHYTDTEAHISS